MLPGWQEELVIKIRPAEESLKDQMLAIAESLVPVATGNLKDHLYVELQPDGTIILGDDADYAIEVEYGPQIPAGSIPNKTAPTGHVPAQPFLRPAIYRTYGTI